MPAVELNDSRQEEFHTMTHRICELAESIELSPGPISASSASHIRAIQRDGCNAAHASLQAISLHDSRPSIRSALRGRFVREHCAYLARLGTLWEALDADREHPADRHAFEGVVENLTELGEVLIALARTVRNACALGSALETLLSEVYAWAKVVTSDLDLVGAPLECERLFDDTRAELSYLTLRQRVAPACHRARALEVDRGAEPTTLAYIARAEVLALAVHEALIAALAGR